MSNEKMSSRQKMINMMYLVLTALLAMNVSKEVLNAFVVVNEGINNSNELVISNNSDLYEVFDSKLLNTDDLNSKEIYSLVKETQKLTLESLDYIDYIKQEILNESGKNKNEKSKILFAKLDDLETATRILTESTENKISKGEVLRSKINSIQEKYLNIVEKANPTLKNSDRYIDYREIYSRRLSLQQLPLNSISIDGENISWVNKNFFNVPVVATDVILSKLQNDILASESQVLDYLFKQIDAENKIVFNNLNAAVIAPKSYLPAGKKFEADIFVAASSSKQESEVFVGKLDRNKFNKDENGKLIKTFVKDDVLLFDNNKFQKIPVVYGKAKFEEIASGIGNKTYEGLIRIKKPTGGYDLYPFEFDYEVAPKSGFSVSPTKMNVLYIGLKNPLSITVSGSKDSDISAKISSGSLSRTGNNWFAKVDKQGKVSLDVYGVIDGEKKKIGTQEFRVRRIPDPISTLDGIEYGTTIKKNRLQSHSHLFPLMKDFVYDVKYRIVSYDFLIQKKGKEVFSVNSNNSSKINSKVKSLLQNAQSKDVVFFQNIIAVGPDGKRRKLHPIVLKVI